MIAMISQQKAAFFYQTLYYPGKSSIPMLTLLFDEVGLQMN